MNKFHHEKNIDSKRFDGQSNAKCNVLYTETLPPHISFDSHVNSKFDLNSTSAAQPNCKFSASNNGGKLKLKNLLTFGSNHKSATNITSPTPMVQSPFVPFDSFCCLVHQKQIKTAARNSYKINQRDQSMNLSQQKSYDKQLLSTHSKTSISPKMRPFNRILSSFEEELFSHHKPKSTKISELTITSNSSIRVIKPTAIKPLVPSYIPTDPSCTYHHDDEPNLNVQYLRSATSADFYDNVQKPHQEVFSEPFSAFHKVNSYKSSPSNSKNINSNSHCRSNSLAESFVYPKPKPYPSHVQQPLAALPALQSHSVSPNSTSLIRPRSSEGRQNICNNNSLKKLPSFDQGSLDSLAPQKSFTIIDSKKEPVHLTLEEVQRIAFGVSVRSSVPTLSSLVKNNDDDRIKQQQSNSGPAAINGRQNTKSKLKLAFENILHKTQCIGPNSPGTSIPSFSRKVSTNSSLSENNQSESSSTIIPSFIPTEYRHINIEYQNDISLQRNLESERNSLTSPFIRRALPPLPRNEQQQSPGQTLSSNIDLDQYNSNESPLSMSKSMSSNNNNDNDTSISLTSTSTITKLRSIGYHSVFSGLGSRNTIPLSSMTHEERQRFLDYVTSIERVKNVSFIIIFY